MRKEEYSTIEDITQYLLQRGVRVENCLEWTGTLFQNGYGRIWCLNKTWCVHNLMWTLKHGSIPAKMIICHKCDNRKCFDIDHLFIGTHLDNKNDSISKGRIARHGKCGTPKLTLLKAKTIREMYRKGDVSQFDLAKIFNVSQVCVSLVIREKTWKENQ